MDVEISCYPEGRRECVSDRKDSILHKICITTFLNYFSLLYWSNTLLHTNFDSLNILKARENVIIAFGRNLVCDAAMSLRSLLKTCCLFSLMVPFKDETSSNPKEVI